MVDIKKLWEEKKPWVMTRLELETLYKEFLKRCEEAGVDPESIDFYALVDPKLTYYENLARIEAEIVEIMPIPVELEEVEYYKKQVEELEKRIEELEKIVPVEEIEKLRRQVKKYKELAKKREEEIRRLVDTIPRVGVSKEEVERIVKAEIEKIKIATRELGAVLKAIIERIRELEKRVVPPAITVEKVELMFPELPPREPTIVEKFDALTKERYATDIDYEFRVNYLAKLVGYKVTRIFFETSDETRKRMGYPTFFELIKKIYREGSERGILTPAHLRAVGFTEEEIKRIMN